MRTILISFLLVLMPILSGISNAADTEAIQLLTETRALLADEKIRWQRIHETPYTDTVTLTQDTKHLTIDICIDPKVQTIINTKPIMRTYVFDRDTRKRIWYVPPYGGIAAHVSTESVRPVVYAGWGRECFTYGAYRGSVCLGPYTTGYTTGIALFYRDTMWYTMSIMVTVGYSWSGHMTPGFGIGFGW